MCVVDGFYVIYERVLMESGDYMMNYSVSVFLFVVFGWFVIMIDYYEFREFVVLKICCVLEEEMEGVI